MNEFSQRVVKIIKSVPEGKVLSYGRVALLAGSPYAARQVGWLLRSMTEKYDLPWQRIINSQGKISIKNPLLFVEQKALLEGEGIEFKNNDTIDLTIYMWEISSFDFEKIYLID